MPKAPWEDIGIVLERGYPDEIEPDKLYLWKGAAHRYQRKERPQEAKDRVKAVWIDGERRPPWQEFKKMPDLRGQIKGTITKSHQEGDVRVVDQISLESVSPFPAEEATDFG